MPDLYHHPLDPQSRFIRLALGEFGIEPNLIEERVYERRHDFLLINPACTTPVLVEEHAPPVPGAGIIAEYLDETRGLGLADRRLLPDHPLVREKVYRRFMTSDQGGGAPDMDAVRSARSNVRYHLRYIGYLIRGRRWLGGDTLTYADLAAAAHLSCVDFLGDVPWAEDEGAKHWYARIKSRPSFRPLLADRMPGMMPSASYADLDF